ncbi:PREDICTED: mRNA turnover protein 4 homolog [Priapulus caudatus]|uniref:Ribosome assembly factor mrt4 n=1 Tax=Priapulus caudatus TaxID=37621 RepID=A0ABM1ES73_PRICU|nr:PREDICTED: mRNA turnover protein 4 homolog [Priapulus caudatus]
MADGRDRFTHFPSSSSAWGFQKLQGPHFFRQVSLTQVKKKPKGRQNLVEEVQKCVDSYARVFVFSVKDMRNKYLKDLREDWNHSRFFLGKNRVVAFALGKTEEKAYRPNLHKIAERLKGQRGLLFTNEPKEAVLQYFNDFLQPDYARTGNVATRTVILESGPLEFPHSMESQLRQLGLPTRLEKGVVTLASEYTVCKKGVALTAEQARILKLFGEQLANFMLPIDCMWSNNGKFESFAKVLDNEMEAGSEGEDSDT